LAGLHADQASDRWRHDALLYRVDKGLDASGDAFTGSNLVQLPVSRRDMTTADAKRADNRPTDGVEHDFRTDDAIREGGGDLLPLLLIGEALLTEAVPKQPTEKRLAATMPDGSLAIGSIAVIGSVRGPDYVETRPQRDISNQVAARLLPNCETADPKAWLRQPCGGVER